MRNRIRDNFKHIALTLLLFSSNTARADGVATKPESPPDTIERCVKNAAADFFGQQNADQKAVIGNAVSVISGNIVELQTYLADLPDGDLEKSKLIKKVGELYGDLSLLNGLASKRRTTLGAPDVNISYKIGLTQS